MKAENFYKKTKIENNFEKLAKNLNYKLNDIRLNGITKDQIPSKLSDYIFNSSENVPIKDSKLRVGKWKRLFFVELDPMRDRELIITFINGKN